MSLSCAAPIRFSVSSVATASGKTKSERCKQLVDPDLLDILSAYPHVRVIDQNPHPERQGDLRNATTEGTVADNSGCRTGELAASGDLGCSPSLVGDVGARNSTCHVDHEADRQFADRRHPAAAGLGDEDPLGRSILDVDVAYIHGHARDCDEFLRRREQSCLARRRPVGNDYLATRGRGDQSPRAEGLGSVMEDDLSELAQALERPCPVIARTRLGRVCQQDAGSRSHTVAHLFHTRLASPSNSWLQNVPPWKKSPTGSGLSLACAASACSK